MCVWGGGTKVGTTIVMDDDNGGTEEECGRSGCKRRLEVKHELQASIVIEGAAMGSGSR